MRHIFVGAVVTAIVVCLTRGALALSYEDIRGKWCLASTTDEFSETTLKVTFNNGRPEQLFKITQYEYRGSSVILHWINGNNKRVQTTELHPYGETR